MGIYFWDNGTRIDTRKGEALLYPPEGGMESDAAASVIKQLKSQGYSLNPVNLPQPGVHRLIIGGFKSAEGRDKLLEKLQKRADRYGITIRTDGAALLVEGLENQPQTEAVMRWVQRKGYKTADGIDFTHEVKPAKPLTALHIQGVEQEENLLHTLEQDWARGERKDEFHGMSSLRQGWSRLLKSARKMVGVFFLMGDSMIIASNVVDSQRRGIPFYQNEGFGEGAGFAVGSSSILMDSFLSEPVGVRDVVERFKSNFQVDGVYDYTGKREGFTPDGASLGRAADATKGVLKSNSVEILMLADFWSGSAMWKGRNSKIMKTEEAGSGMRNVVLNDSGQQAAQDDRLKYNDLISAPLYLGAAATTLLPQEGEWHPFFNPNRMNEAGERNSLLGGVWKALRAFKEKVLDPTILYIPNRILDYISVDPYKVGGRMFMLHNINQVGFGAYNIWQRQTEISDMEKQFANERELFDTQALSPAVSDKDSALNVQWGNLSVRQHETLGKIFNLKDKKGYKEYIAQFRARLGVPTDIDVMRAFIQDARAGEVKDASPAANTLAHHVTPYLPKMTFEDDQFVPTDEQVVEALNTLCTDKAFVDALRKYKESMRTTGQHATKEERYLMVKAMNRLFLEDLYAERQTALFKFGGYATFLSGNLMLSHAGEGSYEGMQNALEASQVSPLAVAEQIVATLKETGQANAAAIQNAAQYMHQDTDLLRWGLSVADFEVMLNAKMQGTTCPFEEELLKQGGWGRDLLVRQEESAPAVEGSASPVAAGVPTADDAMARIAGENNGQRAPEAEKAGVPENIIQFGDIENKDAAVRDGGRDSAA